MINKNGKFMDDPVLKMILARAVCRLPVLFGGGHKRGKFIGMTKDAQGKVISRSFKCPRCEATWSRKPKGTA